MDELSIKAITDGLYKWSRSDKGGRDIAKEILAKLKELGWKEPPAPSVAVPQKPTEERLFGGFHLCRICGRPVTNGEICQVCGQ